MGITEKLVKKENFTSAESSLADYIVNNLDTVYQTSLQDLAKASYVSKPSVIRLYRKIGCHSYREFSIALQLERITSEDNDQISNKEPFVSAASFKELAENVGILAKQIVDHCVKAIDQNGLEDIVNAINEANRIFVYGDEQTELVALSFQQGLKKIGLETVFIDEDPEKQIASVNEDDVVILAVSAFGSEKDRKLKDLIEATSALKILVSIQNDPNENFASDYAIYTYPNGNDFIRNNIMVSRTSVLLGLNIIRACLIKVKNG